MMNEDPNLPDMTVPTARQLMLDLGFKFERRQCLAILIECDDIVLWRRKCLHDINKFRKGGKKTFYLDDICNAGLTTKKRGCLNI